MTHLIKLFNIGVLTHLSLSKVDNETFVNFNTETNMYALRLISDEYIYVKLIEMGFELDGSPYA